MRSHLVEVLLPYKYGVRPQERASIEQDRKDLLDAFCFRLTTLFPGRAFETLPTLGIVMIDLAAEEVAIVEELARTKSVRLNERCSDGR